MDLNQLLSQYLPDETLANLASQAGIQDSHQGVAAAKSVLTTLMQGLSNNTESQNGAGSLINALERNHDEAYWTIYQVFKYGKPTTSCSSLQCRWNFRPYSWF
ncbi:MAG: hypothetical protein IPH93_02930 [Saprospiraceae bacterium]|nr:hypothetical protein [Saprospiraceae bacterium]